LARVGCGVALLVLGLAAVDAWQARAEWLAARDEPERRPSARLLADGPRVVDSAERRAVRQTLAQLSRPWPEAMAGVEAVDVVGVAWLALDVGENGQVRMEGQAPDPAAALAAADALRRQGRWREVLVSRMEKSPDGLLRFALVADPAEGQW
jgi:hypothetical protein